MTRTAWRPLRLLCLGQGMFYVVTGIWPWLHRESFEAVTGPKTDFWLVQTVGALVALTGALLLRAAWRKVVSDDLAALAAGQALALGAVDLVFGLPGRISRVYLLDAPVEFALVVAWWVLWHGARPAQG